MPIGIIVFKHVVLAVAVRVVCKVVPEVIVGVIVGRTLALEGFEESRSQLLHVFARFQRGIGRFILYAWFSQEMQLLVKRQLTSSSLPLAAASLGSELLKPMKSNVSRTS